MEHPENSDDYQQLKVNKGIEQPSIINPYLSQQRHRRRALTTEQYIDGILKGDLATLGRAVTLIESQREDDYAMAQEVIERVLPYSGNSIRIGISGVPGAGKSTSIDMFGLHVLKERGGRLAVLAIDPSSERNKGSILGDKTRMELLSQDPNVFIRPSPSAGALGGVARKTRETIILCEAAGFNTIFVETVGVGQSETAAYSMVDFFLLIALTGAGDELQGIKRGIMEMADGIVINKADGDNIQRAEFAATQYRNALHFFKAKDSGWATQVLTYSGLHGVRVKEVWDMIFDYIDFVKANGYFRIRRKEQAKERMYAAIREGLRHKFYDNPTIKQMMPEIEDSIFKGRITSYTAAHRLLDVFFDIISK